MVNNSGSFGLSYFDPLPVHDCPLRIPSDKRPVKAESIVNGKEVPFEFKDGTIFITVDRLNEYEAIKILF